MRSALGIKRCDANSLTIGRNGDFLDACFSFLEQHVAAAFQGFTTFIDGNRLFKRDASAFKPLDDLFKLLNRFLEAEIFDVVVGFGVGHCIDSSLVAAKALISPLTSESKRRSTITGLASERQSRVPLDGAQGHG